MNRASNHSAPLRRWSGAVTRRSHALTLEPGVFKWHDPKRIARSLMRSAAASRSRQSSVYRSAMSMLVFYINRAGRTLDRGQRRILEHAKDELRRLYGKPSCRRGEAHDRNAGVLQALQPRMGTGGGAAVRGRLTQINVHARRAG